MTRGAGAAGAGRLSLRDAREGTAEERERAARDLALRLDRPLSVLGLVFLLVVVGDGLSDDPRLQLALSVAGWVLWAVFAGEFALRLYVAPRRGRFLRHNWWQLVFLVVPFLRFLRLLWVLRTLRVGRVLGAAVRGSRSAGRLLSSRLGWLAATTTVLVLAISQVLYVAGAYGSYATALYETALATITGEPLTADTWLARGLTVLLALYSLAVVATLAATLGAWFLAPDERSAPGSDAGG